MFRLSKKKGSLKGHIFVYFVQFVGGLLILFDLAVKVISYINVN